MACDKQTTGGGLVPRRLGTLALGVTLAAAAVAPRAAAPARILIVDGESAGPYHRWQVTTPVLKKMLDETQLFAVDVATVEPARPVKLEFARYAALVLNYDAPDERWPDDVKRDFESYVTNGGGVVIVHAADNAFSGWRAYNEMIGVGGWRGRNEAAGPHWYVDGGKLVSDPSAGSAGSHGLRTPFPIAAQDTTHPIMKGLPKTWMHQGDELYASLRGPGKNMTVLATAHSDPANRGTGRDEPALLVVRYGRGRVFHTTLGHDVNAMSSVDFVVTLQRGTEWAATGEVTQKVPSTFPDALTVSYRADLAAMDPANKNGLNPLDPPRR